MAFFNKKNRKVGFMDEIRCDEPSYLIWKWHPSGVQAGASVRENAIRWGSSLRVKDGEVAVFVYDQKDGTMQDFIVRTSLLNYFNSNDTVWQIAADEGPMRAWNSPASAFQPPFATS